MKKDLNVFSLPLEYDESELTPMGNRFEIMGCLLVLTSPACAESYDVFLGSEPLGHLRLRYGNFKAFLGLDVVYEASPMGNGLFFREEREYHLNTAVCALLEAKKKLLT